MINEPKKCITTAHIKPKMRTLIIIINVNILLEILNNTIVITLFHIRKLNC
jgi:hypothetical protein